MHTPVSCRKRPSGLINFGRHKFFLYVSMLMWLVTGCAEPSPNVVQEDGQYSYDDVMERMAAEEAASMAEREE